jgi:hypothetical protein
MAIYLKEVNMKILKTASGKRQIKLSKKEWEQIGKKAGWMKSATTFTGYESVQEKDTGGILEEVEMRKSHFTDGKYGSKPHMIVVELRFYLLQDHSVAAEQKTYKLSEEDPFLTPQEFGPTKEYGPVQFDSLEGARSGFWKYVQNAKDDGYEYIKD